MTKAKAVATPVKLMTAPYDVTEHLLTPEDMAAYLDAWFKEAPNDAAGIGRAVGDIACAKGMTQVAKKVGMRSTDRIHADTITHVSDPGDR